MTFGHLGDNRLDVLRPTQQALKAALTAIASTNDGLAAVLDATPDAVIAFDARRTILCASPRAEGFFGYGRGELTGRSTDELVPPRLRNPDAPPIAATTDAIVVELPGLRRDGSEGPTEWCYGSVFRGAELVFVMTVRDRGALDRALEAVRASDERFQLFVNGVRDCAIFMLDPDARVTSWNDGAARIIGWEADEVLGRPFEIFFTCEDRAAGVPAKLISAALDEGSHESTGWRERKDGTRFWVHSSLTVLRDGNGRVRGFAKITRDLTEHVRAEENERRLIAERAAREAARDAQQRLRASEERLTRLQRMSALLSQAVTPADVSAVFFGECLTLLGASGGALYVVAPGGETIDFVGQSGHPAEAAATFASIPLEARTPLTDAARERRAGFYESLDASAKEYPAIREAMAAGDFEASAALPLIAHDALLGVLGVRFEERRHFDLSDRTLFFTVSDLCAQALERAALFAAERAARATAESASRSKDEFLAMLGHELRNPLAPISTALQLIKMREDGRALREREVIERQLSHLHRLVDDLLDVSRVARGVVRLSTSPIELSDILARAVETASPLLEQRAQELVVAVPKTGLSVNADPMRMAQVVANLLTNASKYTPPRGHVWLTADRDGDEAVVRVRDDGEGIPADLLPDVFNLFVQGARTIARSEGGLGLGLALVKSFVALHGGTVTAASDGTGHGSEFVVRLPALRLTTVPLIEPVRAPPIPICSGKRILLVDDNLDAGEMLAELLRAIGHDVALASDGPTALQTLPGFRPEVAILDIGLPVMDGFELARRIRERSPATPRLIALTGYGADADIAQSRASGFEAHLVKPVEVPLLVAALDPKVVIPGGDASKASRLS